MPPRKNRPVLYEVVSRSQRSRRGLGRSVPPPVNQAGQPTVSRPDSLSSSPASTDQAAPRRGIQVHNGRVDVSLGWLQSLVVVVLLAVLLVAAFRAGVRSATPVTEGKDELSRLLSKPVGGGPPAANMPIPGRGREADVSTPPDRNVRLDQTTERRRLESEVERTAAYPEFTPTPGVYYVLVQYFPRRSQEAATAGRDFLQSNGVEAAVVEGRGDWRLIAIQGFESSAQAQALVSRIRELGAQYARTGSGYDFAGAEARRF